MTLPARFRPDGVALLAEGVDRNPETATWGLMYHGRPPRGGRG